MICCQDCQPWRFGFGYWLLCNLFVITVLIKLIYIFDYFNVKQTSFLRVWIKAAIFKYCVPNLNVPLHSIYIRYTPHSHFKEITPSPKPTSNFQNLFLLQAFDLYFPYFPDPKSANLALLLKKIWEPFSNYPHHVVRLGLHLAAEVYPKIS